MFDTNRHRMLAPLSVSSSDVLIHDNDHHKIPSGHVYLRQQHTVQIIQLVECPPPPPRHIGSAFNDSSASSCMYSSNDSRSSASCDDDDEDDDDESVCSSYCSSDLPPEQLGSPEGDKASPTLSDDQPSQSFSMKRILAWRENFAIHPSASLSEPSLSSSLKRKIHNDDDITMSRSHKRSRSQASQGDASVVSLDMHSCPACDASFPTPQSLRQHGRDAEASNEACSVAVEYAFE